MDWVNTAQGIIALLTGLLGLIGTGIGAFFAIKNGIENMKNKNASEIWKMILEMTDSAIKEAEASGASGEDKKQMVIDMIKASCKSASIDIDPFLDQLSDYIDSTISFVNSMIKK